MVNSNYLILSHLGNSSKHYIIRLNRIPKLVGNIIIDGEISAIADDFKSATKIIDNLTKQ